MDFRQVRTTDKYDFTLRLPNGAETDVIFSLRSPNCREADRVRRKWDGIANRTKKRELDYDQRNVFAKELVIACVAGWSGLSENKKDFPFTPENLEALIDDQDARWIVDAISSELMEESNFLAVSGKA